LPTFLSDKHFDFMVFLSSTVGESSNAPATPASSSNFRRGAGISLPGLSDLPQSWKLSASRGSANPMDEVFWLLRETLNIVDQLDVGRNLVFNTLVVVNIDPLVLDLSMKVWHVTLYHPGSKQGKRKGRGTVCAQG
jgi:hypothetical protein